MKKRPEITRRKTSEMAPKVQQYAFSTTIGKVYIVASEKSLVSISNKQNFAIPLTQKENDLYPVIMISHQQIAQYLKGERKKIDVAYELRGTEFQIKIWKEISKISYGQVSTYQDIAIKIKQPKASRAVGTAIGKNPLCLLIPCHRIICKNGNIGGFSMGANIKRKLLEIEKDKGINLR